MITSLYMGWTDPFTKKWFPITKMTWGNEKYYTVYLQGILSAMEISPSYRAEVKTGLIKLDKIRISEGINVDFRPRMPVNRPYTDVAKLERLGLSTDLNLFDPFEYIARSGGKTIGDSADIFPQVTPDDNGIYNFYFCIRAIKKIDSNHLHLNPELVIEDGLIYHLSVLLDKAPGYIKDIAAHHPDAINLTVAKISYLHSQERILCHARIDSKITIPFTDVQYQPLVESKEYEQQLPPAERGDLGKKALEIVDPLMNQFRTIARAEAGEFLPAPHPYFRSFKTEMDLSEQDRLGIEKAREWAGRQPITPFKEERSRGLER